MNLGTQTEWDVIAHRRWPRYLHAVEGEAIAFGDKSSCSTYWFWDSLNALDIGCGSGQWTKLLLEDGWKVIAYDTDSVSVEICRFANPEAKCCSINPESNWIPAFGDLIDLALCIEVPGVMDANWFAPELHRVLKSGGVFVGVHFNRNSWRGLAEFVRRFFDPKLTAYPAFYQKSYRDWRTAFCSHGFEIIRETGFAWGPFKRDSDSPLVGLFAKLERALGLSKLVRFSPWVITIARKTTS